MSISVEKFCDCMFKMNYKIKDQEKRKKIREMGNWGYFTSLDISMCYEVRRKFKMGNWNGNSMCPECCLCRNKTVKLKEFCIKEEHKKDILYLLIKAGSK